MSDSWTRYRLTWQLASPLHIGYRTIGTIARTRLWVPGRNLWGGFVETIALSKGGIDSSYKEAQKEVNNHLRFEAGFLSYKADGECMPKWEDGNGSNKIGLYYGECSEAELQRLVLASSVSTALDNGVADEGNLFETEYISPILLHAMDNTVSPVYLHAHVWSNNGDSILNQMKTLQIGGERTKGYGRLEKGRIVPCNSGFKMEDDDILVISSETPFPLLVETKEISVLRGQAEPIIGRTTTESGKYGSHLESARICWLPGTVSQQEVKVKLSAKCPGIGIKPV